MLTKWLGLAAVGAVGAAVTLVAVKPEASAASAGPEVTVYKSPLCGCCVEWVNHLRAEGFAVTVIDSDNMSEVKALNGITAPLSSCHTAIVEGYVIEGHVPAGDIRRLLEQRPATAGLAVPGMPVGSPGMEGPNPEAFDVLGFDSTGATTVFARH